MCQQQQRSCESFIKAYTLYLKQKYTFTGQNLYLPISQTYKTKKQLITNVFTQMLPVLFAT